MGPRPEAPKQQWVPKVHVEIPKPVEQQPEVVVQVEGKQGETEGETTLAMWRHLLLELIKVKLLQCLLLIQHQRLEH